MLHLPVRPHTRLKQKTTNANDDHAIVEVTNTNNNHAIVEVTNTNDNHDIGEKTTNATHLRNTVSPRWGKSCFIMSHVSCTISTCLAVRYLFKCITSPPSVRHDTVGELPIVFWKPPQASFASMQVKILFVLGVGLLLLLFLSCYCSSCCYYYCRYRCRWRRCCFCCCFCCCSRCSSSSGVYTFLNKTTK